MSDSFVLLAVLMAAVTYPFRAVPMLVPQMQRLPPLAATYLRLAGPAILASLAAVSLAVRTGESGKPEFYFGLEWLVVALAVAIVIWRKNLFLALILAAGAMALLRAVGLAVI